MRDETSASPIVRIPAQRRASSSPAVTACRCGHATDAHDHFRVGTDCSICGCGRYRPAARIADQLIAVLNRGL